MRRKLGGHVMIRPRRHPRPSVDRMVSA